MQNHTCLSSNQVDLKKSQVILPSLPTANIYLKKTHTVELQLNVLIVRVKTQMLSRTGNPRDASWAQLFKKTKQNKTTNNKICTFWAFFFLWYRGNDFTFCTLQRTSNNRSFKLNSLYTRLPSWGALYSEGSSSSIWSSFGSFPIENK